MNLLYLKQDGVHFVCPKLGNEIEGVVLNRVCISILSFSLLLNRVRVSKPERLTYTQILVENSPPKVLAPVLIQN